MPCILKSQSRLCVIASLLVVSSANKAFLPSSKIQLHNSHHEIHANTISEALLELKGGGDNGYGYNTNTNNYDEDYPQGHGHGSQSGSTHRNDYEDDRYGDRSRERRRNYDDDYYGNDREYAPERPSKSLNVKMPDVGGILRNGNKKVGMMLLGGGAIFTLLGISLFFNKTLMRLGNLLFIAGVPLFIGPGRTTGYFLQPKKARATACLSTGIFLVLVGWPVLGICLEAFGILNLFGNLFPVFMVLLKQMPIVGTVFKGGSSGSKSKSKNTSSTYRDSYRYDDEEEDDRNEEGDRYAPDRYY